MNYTELSKEISYALRHAPWEYELELDVEGFVPVRQLIDAINEGNKYDQVVSINDLEYIIKISDKKRHEIKGNKIRALYGHSVPTHISKERIIPPDVLYHGTTHKALESIRGSGLKPMSRQYVHLSLDTDTAVRVGKRRDDRPIILTIDAKKANSDGIAFYEGNDMVILADYIPVDYIKIGVVE